MVSTRCKILIQADLQKLDLRHTFLDFGVVEILGELTEKEREQLTEHLLHSGWELLDSKRSMMIEKTKNLIVEMIDQGTEFTKVKLHDSITDKIGQEFNYLNNIFAEINGVTIQQFIIMQKIERVKELLSYGEINLTEISYRLHYSSVGHLSRQFKKITGFSPAFFKQLHQRRRSAL